MKIDLYTKFILTVIAVSLASIAFRDVNIIPSAYGQVDQASWDAYQKIKASREAREAEEAARLAGIKETETVLKVEVVSMPTVEIRGHNLGGIIGVELQE